MIIPLWLFYSACIVFVLLVGAVAWLAGLLWQRPVEVPPDPYRGPTWAAVVAQYDKMDAAARADLAAARAQAEKGREASTTKRERPTNPRPPRDLDDAWNEDES